jgi:hypothetical protein
MFFTLHILFMATAILGIIAGVGIAVFFRRKTSWLIIHKTLNTSGLSIIAAGIIMAFIYVSGTGGKHIDGVHQITGLTAFIFTLITILAGFYQFKAKNKLTVRIMHRWLGRLSLLLLLAAITLGLLLINII